MRTVRIVFTALIAPPLFLVTSLCATAAVAGWLGRDSLRWDLLAHFSPVWFGGGLAGLLVGVACRGFDRAALVAAGLIATVAAGGLMAPELLRPAGPQAAAGAPGTIKVVQFNVWAENRDPQGSIDWLVRENPDFAILEETTPPFRAALAAQRRWRIACPACEVMILSKLAPIAAGAPTVETDAAGPLTRATYRDARGTFTVLGVHYAWPTEPEVQQVQEQRLAETLGRFPRERTILAGDFNSAPWSFSRRRWDAVFALPRRDRAICTWPVRQTYRYRWLGLIPFLALDHVYAGPGWATVKVERGPRLGSDHYPVIVTLAPVAPQ